MRKFSLREKAKTLLLCVASLNLGFSSELPWLGFIFAAAFVVLLFRYDASHVPVYRKSIAYGLIVPFAIWWVISPEMEYGMSPWLVFIPAYYLLSLAYLQKRSLGNGGHDVFVLFNGVAVLLLSCFQASRYGILSNLAVGDKKDSRAGFLRLCRVRAVGRNAVPCISAGGKNACRR